MNWDPRWDLGPAFIPKERYTTRAFTEVEASGSGPARGRWRAARRSSRRRATTSTTGSPTSRSSWCASADDEIRAYYNSCRHRGTRLANGCGALADGQITCPFHGWRWNLDGSCAFVLDPEEFGITSLDTPALRLGELRCERRWGFVWVCPDADARPLDEHLAPARRRTSTRCTSRACASSGTARPCCRRTGRPPSTRSTRGTTTTARTRSCCSGPTTPRCATSSSTTAMPATSPCAARGRRSASACTPDEWDDRELLYQQVMHLGRSFEGGLYSDDDMDAAARLRTMEIPEGSTAAAEFSKLVAARADELRDRVPRALARAAGRGHRRVLGVPQPGDAGEPGQLLHVPGPARTATIPTPACSTCGRCGSSRRRTARPSSCASSRRTTTTSGA